jgi:hypothetical protein
MLTDIDDGLISSETETAIVTTVTLHPRWLRLALTALMASVLVACGSGSGETASDATAMDPASLTGTWVGQNVVMTVTDAGAHIEMPCSHGDIEGALAQNPFSVRGTFGRDAGPALDDHPALYSGNVAGGTMTLEIRLTDTNALVGSFTLIRGTGLLVAKCV